MKLIFFRVKLIPDVHNSDFIRRTEEIISERKRKKRKRKRKREIVTSHNVASHNVVSRIGWQVKCPEGTIC